MLAVGVNNNSNNEVSKATYTDSTSSSFTQSLSDWANPQAFAGESIVLSSGCAEQHRHDQPIGLVSHRHVRRRMHVRPDARIFCLSAALERWGDLRPRLRQFRRC